MKIIGVSICILLIILATFTPIVSSIKALNNEDETPVIQDILDGGWIEEREGIRILYVNGSHYEMGYQHGSLLKYECLENLRAFLYYIEQIGYSFNQLLDIWNIMKEYIPQQYIEEMQGLADGAGLSFDEVAALYASFDCLDVLNCFGIATWGPATKSSKLIHVRSCDLPFTIKDPVTGNYVHNNCILIVRKPDNGYASLIPTVAGLLNCGGGINEKGIGLGNKFPWSKDHTFNGMPIKIKGQYILDQALTAEDAINILITNRTLGYNFVVSDAKIPIGYAVETTTNFSYVGTWDNPVESTRPCWSIDHVIRRTNFFIEPEIATTQRDRYHPGGLIGFLKLIFSVEIFFSNPEKLKVFTPNLMFPIWRNYKIMSKEIEKQWGTLDLDNAQSMLRNVYNGKTDMLLAIMVKFGKGYGFLESWNQWVACPETGDMLVSFASNDKYASKNPVHHFNLFELLQS